MVNGKLILICRSGGDFEKNDDGTLAYNGGEAEAVAINSEILFDDLKLKLAEICALDYETVSIKYFLPQNNRTPISISNDKNLKRMLEFHASSVTTDVFVSGKEGFNHEAMNIDKGRETGIKVAESVYHTATPPDTTSSPLSASDCDDSDNPIYVCASPLTSVKPTGQNSIDIDISASPTKAVNKRRRATSRELWEDDPTVISETGDERFPKRMRQISVADDSTEGKNDDVSLEKLIALWKESITGIGQDFKSVYDFRDALQKYAIANRFVYTLIKNESRRARGVCVVEGCPWTIHASWVPGAHSFRIKTFNKLHTCIGQPWKYSHSTKNWLINIINDSLRDSPHHKLKDIADAMLRDFGIELNYTRVRRDVENAHKMSYNQLTCYCEKIKESNPGSHVKLITGVDKKFEGLFISFIASINGFRKGCRPLLFLEETSLRSNYQEVLLTATAVDGDEGLFPLAFAIVDNQNDKKWNWFLEQLKSVLPTSGSITFVSDRERGLKETLVKVFPNSYHGYSMYHLLKSFKKSLKGPFEGEEKAALPGYFVAAAHSTRVIGFKNFTEQIKNVASHAYDWVMQIEPECWTTISAKGEHHNQITENVGELYAKLMEESKDLPIKMKIDAIIRMITSLFNMRKSQSSKWLTKLTPSKEEKLHEEVVDARGLKVLPSSNTIFDVGDEVAHVVNLDEAECTCLGWQSTGLPCRHAIAVFNRKGKNPCEFCSKYFTVDSFRSIFSESINPVPCESCTIKKKETSTDSVIVLPPNAFEIYE